MIRREELFIVTLAFLTTIFNITLILIGEERIDVYIALFIMTYFISITLIGGIEGKHLSKISALFIVVFLSIITYRILQIVYPEIPNVLDLLTGG